MTDSELNTAVAKKLGAENNHDLWLIGALSLGATTDRRMGYDPDLQHVYWNPAENLDDAFFAAEQTELFDSGKWLWKRNGKWGISEFQQYEGNVTLVEEESAARAICVAVVENTN